MLDRLALTLHTLLALSHVVVHIVHSAHMTEHACSITICTGMTSVCLQDVVKEVLAFAEVNSGSSTPDRSGVRQDHRPPLSPLQCSADGTVSPLMYAIFELLACRSCA